MKLTSKMLKKIIKEEIQNFQMTEIIEDLDTVEKNIERMSKEQAIDLLTKIVDMKEDGQTLPARFKFYEALLKRKVGFKLSKEDKEAIAREKMLFQSFVSMLDRNPTSEPAKRRAAKATNKEQDFQTNPALE